MVGNMADASRTLFSQKAWQMSHANVRGFTASGGMEEGVDQVQETCFQSLQMPIQLPAHTQAQFNDN